jgi:hypothetical protein
MRKLTSPQASQLKYIWNAAHEPRRRGRGTARCLRGGSYWSRITHEALLRRGLIRESSRRGYTRLTAAGMRVLGVKATEWRRL